MSALDQLLLQTYRNSVDSRHDDLPTKLDLVSEVEPTVVEKIIFEKPRAESTEQRAISNKAPRSPIPETQSSTASAVSRNVSSIALSTTPVERTPSFRADWELDTFRWPAVCLRLEALLAHDFDVTLKELERMRMDGGKIVMITSPYRGAGRTTMSLCLARQVARSGRKVAIVDMDHRHPSMVERLGVYAESGIEALGTTVSRVEEISIVALEDGISLLPLVQSSPTTPWRNPVVRDAVQQITTYFDLVIADSDSDEETLQLLPEFAQQTGTSALIVHDQRRPAPDEVQLLASRLARCGIPTMGIIENYAA